MRLPSGCISAIPGGTLSPSAFLTEGSLADGPASKSERAARRPAAAANQLGGGGEPSVHSGAPVEEVGLQISESRRNGPSTAELPPTP